MKVKFKKLVPEAITPSYAKEGDAGLDLTAISVNYDLESGCVVYDTGLAFEIPKGFVGLLFNRSSVYKKELFLTNAVGVLDSSYRGTVMFKFKIAHDYWEAAHEEKLFNSKLNAGLFSSYFTADNEYNGFESFSEIYKVGDRIGQLLIIPYPEIELEESEELSITNRGALGYGSTGN